MLRKKKENKEQELEKAKKLLEEAAELEKLKAEQSQSTPVIATGTQAAEQPQPTKEELSILSKHVEYYSKNYRGIFNPAENPAQIVNPMDAEIASLLFGILQELRAIKEKM